MVGDVFAQLLEHLARKKGPRTNLRAYLYQITYHLIVDKAREKRHIISFESAQALASNINSVDSQIEDKALLDDLIEAMNSALTLDQRHVLVLRFVEGFNLKETAAILDKSVSNIKVIENRGIKKLRQTMGQSIEDGK